MTGSRCARVTRPQTARVPTCGTFRRIVAAAGNLAAVAEEMLDEKVRRLGLRMGRLVLAIGEFERVTNPGRIPLGAPGRLAIGVEGWRDGPGVLFALTSLIEVRDELIERAKLKTICAGKATMLGTTGLRRANPRLGDSIQEIRDETVVIDRPLLGRLLASIRRAHEAVKPETRVIHQENGLAIFHGPFGFTIRSAFEERWEELAIACPMCRRRFSQRSLEGPYKELPPSRRKRRSASLGDRWFPYDHERIRSLMGSAPRSYKGQLCKLAKRKPRLRRRGTAAECRRFGVRAGRFLYDVVLLHHLIESRE